jgi:hypothetical protein
MQIAPPAPVAVLLLPVVAAGLAGCNRSSWTGIGDSRRPKKFSGKLTPGAGQSYVILRSEDYKEPEAVTEELKRLEGHWISAENKTDGLLIEGDHMVFLYRTNQKGSEAQFAVALRRRSSRSSSSIRSANRANDASASTNSKARN